jgi:hypothetical protein
MDENNGFIWCVTPSLNNFKELFEYETVFLIAQANRRPSTQLEHVKTNSNKRSLMLSQTFSLLPAQVSATFKNISKRSGM